MLNYAKLWLLLDKRDMQRTDLVKNKVVSTATLAKLGKNENVNSSVIQNICDFLDCQPGDIMENIKKEKLIETAEAMNKQMSEMFKMMSVTSGMSMDAVLEEFKEFMKKAPEMIEEIKKNPDEFDF